jgi:hypothetical protein
LVELALQGPTQVSSATTFIDESGTLRDSASFTHDMVVRGVRVLAYGQEAGEPKAKIRAEHQAKESQGIRTPQSGRSKAFGCERSAFGRFGRARSDAKLRNGDMYQARLHFSSIARELTKAIGSILAL